MLKCGKTLNFEIIFQPNFAFNLLVLGSIKNTVHVAEGLFLFQYTIKKITKNQNL